MDLLARFLQGSHHLMFKTVRGSERACRRFLFNCCYSSVKKNTDFVKDAEEAFLKYMALYNSFDAGQNG